VGRVDDPVLTTATTVDPRHFEREDDPGAEHGKLVVPGRLRMAPLRLRVPNWARVAVSELGTWAESTSSPTTDVHPRPVRIIYRSRQTTAAAPKLTIVLRRPTRPSARRRPRG
jgi:hypothetical protein